MFTLEPGQDHHDDASMCVRVCVLQAETIKRSTDNNFTAAQPVKLLGEEVAGTLQYIAIYGIFLDDT